jgi:PAS domain S-box-containing protein/diguanylate cyclase (GGDEF)-like protein
MDKKSFQKIQASKNYQTINLAVKEGKIKFNVISITDKTPINKQIADSIKELVFIWIIILLLTFIISILFVKKVVLTPIENLRNSINDIKTNNFKNIKVNSNDEIGQITNEFNILSKELANNLSFLNSYKNIMDKANIVTKADLKGNIIYVNSNFEKVSGYTKDEAIGKPHNIVRDPNTPKEIFEDMWKKIQDKKTWRGILKNQTKYGDYYWIDTVIEPVIDNNGNIVEYIAVRHDITELVKQREKLKTIVNYDSLTGVGNRFKLTNDIKNHEDNALAILDIDKFREINDFYGHHLGDKLIKEVCNYIKDIVQQNDNCDIYRLQADQFILRNSKITKESFYDNLLKIIQIISNKEFELDGQKLSIKLTGAISFEENNKLLQTVEMALQIARNHQKDLLVYVDDISLDKEYENNIKWTNKIKEAIENDNIIPFYQPIIDNKNEKIEKFESLIRLKDSDGKIYSPFFFLDISKKTKYYTKLTQIMIEKTFETFKDSEYEFSINLSVDDILNHDVQTTIFIMLEITGAGSRCVFEIVESESIESFDLVLEFIENIKTYNCKIAIDDFGTGYSNFEYLIKLKADYIKIDGSMIKNIDKDRNALMVVTTIVDFAKRIGMKIVAEFVENEEILNIVKTLGIDYSQGYYFSPPKEKIKL